MKSNITKTFFINPSYKYKDRKNIEIIAIDNMNIVLSLKCNENHAKAFTGLKGSKLIKKENPFL